MTTVDDAKNPRIVSTWSWMNDAPPYKGSWEKGDALRASSKQEYFIESISASFLVNKVRWYNATVLQSKMRTTSTPCHARVCVASLIRNWQICTSLNMMEQKKMMTDYWSYRNQPRRMTPSSNEHSPTKKQKIETNTKDEDTDDDFVFSMELLTLHHN